MASIDYDASRSSLDAAFSQGELAHAQDAPPAVDPDLKPQIDALFRSKTQAYREVLLGCTLAKLADPSIDIRKPYVDQGPNAFSGRTLDERVVNPALQAKRIPCSRGPYLSVFRRSVQFDASIRPGLRDKSGYDAFLGLLSFLESAPDPRLASDLLLYQAYKFVLLRESSHIPLARIQRLSLAQYDTLVSGLLSAPSGGRYPVIIAAATFAAIADYFAQDWVIEVQGINVADAAAGAGGDITISAAGRVLLAVEVTERPIDHSRVVSTFNAKIAPAGIEDYLFLTRLPSVHHEAKEQAHLYFAQGHEVNFVDIKDWVVAVLATMGKAGRAIFAAKLIGALERDDTPSSLRMVWNEQLDLLTRMQ